MSGLQKRFLMVPFFNRISCNKGLKTKISGFFLCFFSVNLPSRLTLLGLQCSRIRKTASIPMSHRPKKYKNLHPQIRAPQMEQKHDKCWNSPIFEGKLQVLSVIWVKWKQPVCSITLCCPSTFYSLLMLFFVLEIFKFKYGKFFIRYSASISKF